MSCIVRKHPKCWNATLRIHEGMDYVPDCGRKNEGSVFCGAVVLTGLVGVLASSPENISASEDDTRNTARPLMRLWLSCWNTWSASSTGNTLNTGGMICSTRHMSDKMQFPRSHKQQHKTLCMRHHSQAIHSHTIQHTLTENIQVNCDCHSLLKVKYKSAVAQ